MLPDGFIFIQRDWLSSNSLLLLNGDESVLIDTGYATHAEMTLRVLEEHLQQRSLDKILNTHLHSDHCGGNSLLQNRYPLVEIHVPETQFDSVFQWDQSKLSFAKTGQACFPFKASHSIASNKSINLNKLHWNAIHSPGHDNDSLMFFQPDYRILVSADALWEKGVSVVFPELDEINGFDPMFETYDLIERLNPAIVLPGHGRLFTDVNTALALSRQKLFEFKADPRYHAMYSAKVLIKFKLMELRHVQFSDFVIWCMNSLLMLKIHGLFFSSLKVKEWINSILSEFQQKKSIQIKDGWIFNL
jgi:glyoxylase-like metal-dependent hydrolase (beta-lactamase superfamily II)